MHVAWIPNLSTERTTYLPQLPTNRQEIELRVDRAIRLALLRRGGVPDHFTSHAVRNGVLTLVVDGEFEVREKNDSNTALFKVRPGVNPSIDEGSR